MLLRQIFSLGRKKRRGDAIALRVAARSRSAGWNRLSQKVHSMTLSEARGYIRSRTSCIIYRELNIALSSDTGSTDWNQHDLFRAAADLLVQHLLGDLLEAKNHTTERRLAA